MRPAKNLQVRGPREETAQAWSLGGCQEGREKERRRVLAAKGRSCDELSDQNHTFTCGSHDGGAVHAMGRKPAHLGALRLLCDCSSP